MAVMIMGTKRIQILIQVALVIHGFSIFGFGIYGFGILGFDYSRTLKPQIPRENYYIQSN